MTYFLSHPTHEHDALSHQHQNLNLLSLRHYIDDLALYAPNPLQALHALTSHHQILYPRFDMEEDAQNYYLVGDLPGLDSADVHIEARDKHSLIVEGIVAPRQVVAKEITTRNNAGAPFDTPLRHASKHEYNAPVHDSDDRAHDAAAKGPAPGVGDVDIAPAPLTAQNSTSGPEKHDAAGNHNGAVKPQETAEHYGPGHPNPASFSARVEENERSSAGHHASGRRILIQERQAGHFARTFRFPHAIVEQEEIEAHLHDGVLRVVVPKKVIVAGGEEEGRGRGVVVQKGEREGRKRAPFGLTSSQLSYF